MKCPDCGNPQDMSTSLIPGVEVLRCRPCRKFRIKDDERVVPCGAGSMDRLRVLAHEILAERRHKEMIESDIEDPRWETWTH